MPNDKPVLKPNDLAVIYMGYKAEKDTVTWVDGTKHTSSEDLNTVMIGLIDTVTRTRNGGGNGIAPSITTTVTGRDFGKILIKSMLKFYPELGWDKEKEQKFFLTEQGWITLLKAFTNDDVIKGSPAKILDTALRFILHKIVNVKWTVYDDNTYQGGGGQKSVALGNILRYKLAQTNFFIPFFMTAQQYEGSVWNLMERVHIKPFTELFIDTRDRWEVDSDLPHLVNETVEEDSNSAKGQLDADKGKWEYPATMFGKKDGAQAVIAFRNTPFDKSAWEKLRTHTISYLDVIQETLSYSDNENYNLFWAGTTLTPFSSLDLKRVQPPLINEENITRYGLNALEIQVEGLELDPSLESTQAPNLVNLANDSNAKLKAWYEHNVDYLSGSLEIRGKADAKIGQRLIYESIGREFYIEGVTQNFQVYGEWHTSLSVTRGMKIGTAPDHTQYVREIEKPDPPVPATQDPAPSKRYYTVVEGDTLWEIASKGEYYGDGTRWTELWEANKDMLIARDSRNESDPGHWIYSGQVLVIP
jgi:hypothetical protein